MIPEKIINLLGIRPNGVMLCPSELIGGKPAVVIMQTLTEQEEISIDKSEKLYGTMIFKRSDGYTTQAKDIYLYGEVNLNNEDDIKQINKFNLIGQREYDNWIHSNFDFEKGIASTIDGKVKGYSTWDAVKWFKYCYCLLGKPKRIIVYKCPKCYI